MYTRFSLAAKTTLAHIWVAVLFITIYSALVYLLYEKSPYGHIAIPLSVSTVLGTAISILLGFRTSAAYDRWWEARKIWGAIINDSRTLVRQGIGFISGEDKDNDLKVLSEKQIAWCYALNHSLRGLPMPQTVKDYLTDEEFGQVSGTDNIPNAILKIEEEIIAKIYRKQGLDTYQFTAMDRTLKALCDHMGMCERIKKTVFPIHYSLFTRLAIMIFMVLLPFGMVESVGILVIPITLVVILFFSMIDIIARFMQDPFENKPTDTPMSTICRTIEINLLQMTNVTDTPEPLKPDARGILM